MKKILNSLLLLFLSAVFTSPVSATTMTGCPTTAMQGCVSIAEISGDNRVVDSFTEGSDTVLSSHTPGTGTGWTEESNTTSGSAVNVIASVDNLAADVRGNNSHIIYTAQPNPSDPAYYVQVFIRTGDFSAGDKVFLIARYGDANNFYFFGGSSGGGTPNLKIYKVVGGTVTTLASDLVTVGGSFQTWKFQVAGSTLTAFINGVETISAEDSDLTLTGKGGIGWGNLAVSTDDVSQDWDLDDFLMVD